MDDILPNDVANNDLNYYSKLLQTFDSSKLSNFESLTNGMIQPTKDFLNGSHKNHKVKNSSKLSDSSDHQENDRQERLSHDSSPIKERKRRDSNSAESNLSSNISVEGSFTTDLVESLKKKKKKKKLLVDSVDHLENGTQEQLSQDDTPKKKRDRKDSNSAESTFSSNVSVEGSNDLSFKKKKKKKKKTPVMCEDNDPNVASQELKDEETREKLKKKKHKDFPEISRVEEDFISYEEIKEERCSSSSHNEMEPFESLLENCIDKYKSTSEVKENDLEQNNYNEDRNVTEDCLTTPPIKKKKKKNTKLHNISDSVNENEFSENDRRAAFEQIKLENVENKDIESSAEDMEEDRSVTQDSLTSPPVKKNKKKNKKLHNISDSVNENELSENGRQAVFEEIKLENVENEDNEGSTDDLEEIKKIRKKLKSSAEKKINTTIGIKFSNSDDSDIDKSSSDDESAIDFEDLMDKVTEQKRIEIESYDNILQHLFIVVDWELPEAHLFEKSITTCPKNEVQRRIKMSGVEIKRGAYSRKEDDIIKANWEKFSEIYSISNPSVFLWFQRKNGVVLPLEERIKFAQFLGRGLTNRLLFSIYQRFRVLYRDINKGRFNDFENQLILSFLRSKMAKDSMKISKLAKVLNRDRVALSKHCEILLNERGSSEHIQWTVENMEKLLKSLMNNMGLKKAKKLKRAKISMEIWKRVSADVHVPARKLKYVWEVKLYPRLFIKENIDTNAVIQVVLKQLHESRLNDWRLINWDSLASLFPGVTPTWLNQFVRGFLRCHIPDWKEKPLRGTVKRLLDSVNSNGQFDHKFCSNLHKPLTMLKFKSGHLYEPE